MNSPPLSSFAIPAAEPQALALRWRALALVVIQLGALLPFALSAQMLPATAVLALSLAVVLSVVPVTCLDGAQQDRALIWSLLATVAVAAVSQAAGKEPLLLAHLVGLSVCGLVLLAGIDERVIGPLELLAALGVVALPLLLPGEPVSLFKASIWALSLLLSTWLMLRHQAHARRGLLGELARQREAALADPLSGLLNRRGWDVNASQVYAQALRERRPLTLAMIDVDHFKQINDRYGHALGDLAIRHLAGLIRNSVRRPLDLASRQGGEEFALLWYDCGMQDGQRLASELREQLQRTPLVVEGSTIAFTVSIGLSQLTPDEGQSLELAMASADAALYAAKASGRDRIASKCYLPR